MRTARPMWSTISSAISCIVALLHYCIIALLHYCIRERGTNEPSEPMGDVAHNMIGRVTPPEQSERNNSSNIQTQQRSNLRLKLIGKNRSKIGLNSL
eukprot:COSAG06_NODE_1032_length_11010_cov_13.156448_6_plen_97_part_00